MANSTIEILINNIKYFRSLKNLTQEKLSEISGISKDYLSEIERGKKTPSIKRLIKIALSFLLSYCLNAQVLNLKCMLKLIPA